MGFDKIGINDIVSADYNPRIMSDDEMRKLSDSMGEFGLVDPIIINLNNNRIIGGHQRYNVLKNKNVIDLNLIRLGDVGWCFTDDDLKIKSEEYEKALNIALNKITGEWNNKKLNDVLVDLDLSNINLELTGFSDEQLMSLNIDYNENFEDMYDELKEIQIDGGVDKGSKKYDVTANDIDENNNDEIIDYGGESSELNEKDVNFEKDIEMDLKNEITVVCEDEKDMLETFDKLESMGLDCRMIVK